MQTIQQYVKDLHPFNDGRRSQTVEKNKASLCKERDALSKQASGLFAAKASCGAALDGG